MTRPDPYTLIAELASALVPQPTDDPVCVCVETARSF